ncbi:iron sulfur cluster assembly protein 1, mitochondrial [[Candida] railenensis]|uniref:Iron-sulfur cluster assembly protein n=1 Tax=[Candida] railenensis TaxID=45579 RepID=A0A9P0QSL8_9ASCO|nr:iron sulfur cluster assembly protein 1, mitochondrial [[Candida] railenensis]
MFTRSAIASIRRTGASSLVAASRASLATPMVPAMMTVAPKRMYHDKVLDHYANPRNVGVLNKLSNDVGTGLVGAPACGDVMRLQIQVDDATGVIKDVKFKTFGCGSAIASSSYVTEVIKGKTLEEALKVKNTHIAKELSLPPVKLHCSMLAEDAIKSAIKDYKTKRSSMAKPTLGPDAVPAHA